MALTRDSLREYLATKTRADLNKIDDDGELFSTGVIDSFTMVDLVTFLSAQTGSRVGMADISIENFDSVNRILKFVQSRG